MTWKLEINDKLLSESIKINYLEGPVWHTHENKVQ
jgi:hypothetical protein